MTRDQGSTSLTTDEASRSRRSRARTIGIVALVLAVLFGVWQGLKAVLTPQGLPSVEELSRADILVPPPGATEIARHIQRPGLIALGQTDVSVQVLYVTSEPPEKILAWYETEIEGLRRYGGGTLKRPCEAIQQLGRTPLKFNQSTLISRMDRGRLCESSPNFSDLRPVPQDGLTQIEVGISAP